MFARNSLAGGNYERLQGHQDNEAGERVIEVHHGVGWKTAFGIHLAERIDARNQEEKKVMPIRGIYVHPDHRPGTNPKLQKLWLWIAPYTVWDKDGPKGFISRNRAVDFYYQVSRELTANAIASIERKGWFKTPS
ncbi:MAG: hypothetical protein EBR40_10030 [Proteobacteria bacterium]|nr:hypothetical protein [Pseudomonadota bacterium]